MNIIRVDMKIIPLVTLVWSCLLARTLSTASPEEVRFQSEAGASALPYVFVVARPFVDSFYEAEHGAEPLFKVDLSNAPDRADFVLKATPDAASGTTAVSLDCRNLPGAKIEFELLFKTTIPRIDGAFDLPVGGNVEWVVASRFRDENGEIVAYTAKPPAILPYYILIGSAKDKKWLARRIPVQKVYVFFDWEGFQEPLYGAPRQ